MLRLARVVWDTEKRTVAFISFSSRRMSVDLPQPEGPDMTYSILPPPCLLQVLDLLPDALHLPLDGQALSDKNEVLGFGADGVHFPEELLRQEIEHPTHGLARPAGPAFSDGLQVRFPPA